MKTNEDNKAAIKALGQSLRAIVHTISRTIHASPETSELRDYVEKQVAEALAMIGAE